MQSPEMRVSYLLNQAVSAARRHLARHLREVGVSQIEWPVLRHAIGAEERGGYVTMSALHDLTELDDIALRHTVEHLTERDLVIIRPGTDPSIALTPRARAIAAPLLTVSEHIITRGTSGFTAAELAAFAGLLERFLHNLQE